MGLLHRYRSLGTRPDRPSVPEGERIYVVGDIHGCADLLGRMVDLIESDLSTFPIKRSRTVFLGDYIDRGPDASGVVDRLANDPFPTDVVRLMGNHERMLLDFLQTPQTGEVWISNGGLETLHSYGVSLTGLRAGKGYQKAAEALSRLMPNSHLAFLQFTSLTFTVGDYFFCHAGIRPGIALHAQREKDLLWIRDRFLASNLNHEKMIVHGHSPVETPEIRKNRINIDTGAYVTGRLTCLVLDGDLRRFLSTG